MLKEILERHNIKTAELGAAVRQTGGHYQGRPFGRSAMSRIINQGEFPRATPIGDVTTQIEAFLTARGIPRAELKGLWTAGGAAAKTKTSIITTEEDTDMLPKKHSLLKQTKTHFKLKGSLFGDVETDRDMYLGPNVRYAREMLMEAMRNGGFKALVGESGSGKTTLIEECEEQIRRDDMAVTLIRPPIVGMDTDTSKGSVMKARNILMYIMDVINPNAKHPVDVTRFVAHVHRELSARQGQRRFCLVIDDAHRLNWHTLVHLKDIYELKFGRQRLLGIVLLGQPSLAVRLDPSNADLIQISQRCEVIPLPPLGDDLPDYLEARFGAVGLSATQVLAPDAYDAIRARLTGTASGGGRKQMPVNLAYPLAVNNIVIAAMNLAANLGSPLVTADVVREV